MILADGPGAELLAHLGSAAPSLYAQMLSDTLQVAASLPGATITVCYSTDTPPPPLPTLPQAPTLRPLHTSGAAAVAEALAVGLTRGEPTIVLRANLPHLPIWRLRDAATHLAGKADLVVGPADHGGWYLLGVRPSTLPMAQIAAASASPLGALLDAARGHVTHILPPWFGIHTVADLASLVETLRTMPPTTAAATRALLEAGQATRAVGG